MQVDEAPGWIIRNPDDAPPQVEYPYILAQAGVAWDGGTDTILARFPPISDLKQGPFHGLLATVADGGRQLVVSAFDSVASVDVSSVQVGLEAPLPLEVKLVPLSRGAITSLAVVPPSEQPTPAFLTGYALALEQLFRFTAETPTRWRSDEIALPPGDPIALWTDGARGRVGYRDGTVYAIPSRVPISGPLPESSPTVSSYGHVCGQAFVLGSQGLYRLVPSLNGPVGAWTLEPGVEALLPGPAGAKGYAGGLLYTYGDELELATPYGSMARLRVPGCQ